MSHIRVVQCGNGARTGASRQELKMLELFSRSHGKGYARPGDTGGGHTTKVPRCSINERLTIRTAIVLETEETCLGSIRTQC